MSYEPAYALAEAVPVDAALIVTFCHLTVGALNLYQQSATFAECTQPQPRLSVLSSHSLPAFT